MRQVRIGWRILRSEKRDDELPQVERDGILNLLNKSAREADEVMQLAIHLFSSGNGVQ